MKGAILFPEYQSTKNLFQNLHPLYPLNLQKKEGKSKYDATRRSGVTEQQETTIKKTSKILKRTLDTYFKSPCTKWVDDGETNTGDIDFDRKTKRSR